MCALFCGWSMAEGLVGRGSESQRGLETTVTHRQTKAVSSPRPDATPARTVTLHLAQGGPSGNSGGEKRGFSSQLGFPLGFPEPLVPCLQNGRVTPVLPISSDCHGEQMKE